MMRKILVILIVLMTAAAAMAETTFQVIPPRTVIAGNKFSVTFRLKNGEGSGLKAPQIEGCELLYGPSTSMMQNYQWVNGRSESSTTCDYTFTYRADKAGEYTIGEATITSGGKTYTSKPARFNVLPPDQTSSSSASSGAAAADPSDASAPVDPSAVIVRIILNKSHAYEQEAILCTIKLYTKHSISSFIPTVQPAFDGFLIEELPVSPTLNEVEHYNGQNYMTAVLKQCIIFPQKSGKLTINSGKYNITVVQYKPLGGFWGGSRPVEREISTQSNSASISITPLPQPQPEGFTGAVGSFSIDSRISTNSLKTNEAASLVYTIKGTGNVKYIKEPQIDFPSEFEQYQPQIDVDTRPSGANVTGTVTIDYTFVPQSVGTFSIGADKFVYFNPEKKEYVTLSTPAYSLKVAKGAASASSTSAVDRQGIASKNTDILHIKMGPLGQSHTHTFIYRSWWYWPLYVVLAMALAATVWTYSKRMRLNADVTGRRLANANKVARRRLRTASKYLQAHDLDHFYEETLRAIWGYLGDKLRLPASQLTRDSIQQKLDAYGAPAETIDALIGVIDECEMARYSPAKSDAQVEDIYNRAAKAMNSLENIKSHKA